MRSNVAGQQTKETFTGKEQDQATGYYYFGARYYDAALAGWGTIDPAGQYHSPYVYAGNSPVAYVDADGNLAWFVPIIIGAVANVGFQAASGNIDNFGEALGYAAVGAAAGALGAGIGTGVSAALGGSSFSAGFAAAFSGSGTLAGAGITGVSSSFFTGAAIGGTAGFGAGFTSGFGNSLVSGQSFGNSLGAGLNSGLIGGASGGFIGGVTGGISAVRDGRRFFDGARVQEQVLIDRQIPFVRQQGAMNCGPALCESISQSRGGSVTQQSIRSALGGNPNTTPLGDANVFSEFTNQSGIRVMGIPGGLNTQQTLNYMKSGYDIAFNIKSVPGIGHAVAVNRITQRTITKISGKVINRPFVDVVNPAIGQYVRVSNSTLINAYNTFLIFP